MTSVRAILFDLDGVLIDSYEVWFHLMQAAAKKWGYAKITRDQFHSTWGQGVQADVDNYYPKQTVEEVEVYFNQHYQDHIGHMKVFPDSAPTFAALRAAEKSIAVITNTPSPIAREVLGVAGLAPTVLVGGTDVPHSKPAPDMIYHACDLLGVDKEAAVVVGDSNYDLEAAASARVRFIGYRMKTDESVQSLNELLKIIK